MKIIKQINFFPFVILFLFFAASLEANYIRSIRIGSFPTQQDAQLSLKTLQQFVHEHQNIVMLQDEYGFEFKTRRSGRFYITLAEPFTDRKVLQEVLDTLRLVYPDIYVTKLKKMPQKEENLDVDSVEDMGMTFPKKSILHPEDEINLDDIEVIETKPIPNIKEQNSSEKLNNTITPERNTFTQEVKSMSETRKSYDYLYIFALLFCFFVIFILIRYSLRYKRENEIHINREMYNAQTIEQLQIELNTKDKLLSHVSHELRTPMTAIMGLTHLILESELSKLQKDYIVKIESSSQHMLNLINDILDVSKIQAGELVIEKSEFNINEVLEYVLSVNAMSAKRNSIVLSMDVALDVPSKLIGDSLRLGQVLINLLGNAIKFTKNGEVSLTVSKFSSFAEGITLEFVVSDTGIGMTKEQVENIFNSYYQADDSTSRKFGGTGLGLTISKELVEMMDGEIRVASTKDVGTTFTFTVKLMLKDAQNKRYYRLPSSSMLNKKILIVDTSNKNIIPLIKSLGYFNYKTTSVVSLDKESLPKTEKFDIVLVNQYSLTRDSIEIIQEMQKVQKTKVVILNDLYSGVDSTLFEGMHIDSYLQVPATQQSVLNLIVDLFVAKNLDKRSRKITIKDKLKVMAKKKILIAEDNDVNQKVIQGLLFQTGIELTFVDDGQEAVDLIRKNIHFDLLIMDINMPKLNGYQASKEIRKSSKYNNMPILALTGDITDEAISKAYANGMQGHISKPIIVDIFYKKIYDTLRSPDVKIVDKESLVLVDAKNEDGFEELSISVGLGRCHGDSEFYISILQDFKAMYQNSTKTLENLCAAGKFKEARRMAMDIKDIALNIGAYNLCESAATMEYEFEKGSRSNWKEFISFYDLILKKLFNEIEMYLSDN